MSELFRAIGLGLLVLLPLANPLTTVALFLALGINMSQEERKAAIAHGVGLCLPHHDDGVLCRHRGHEHLWYFHSGT